MSRLQNGMLVQHVSLGVGKVVALEPAAVHVFFETCVTKYATKLRLPLAMTMLTAVAETGNASLDGLSFAFDVKSQRYGVAPATAAGGGARPKPAARTRKPRAAKTPPTG